MVCCLFQIFDGNSAVEVSTILLLCLVLPFTLFGMEFAVDVPVVLLLLLMLAFCLFCFSLLCSRSAFSTPI